MWATKTADAFVSNNGDKKVKFFLNRNWGMLLSDEVKIENWPPTNLALLKKQLIAKYSFYKICSSNDWTTWKYFVSFSKLMEEKITK